MQESRYSLSLYPTLLIICLFLGIVVAALSGCSEKSKQTKASYENESEKGIKAELPQIGDIVTTERAIELCEHYGLNQLAERIEDNPDFSKNGNLMDVQ